MFKPYQKAQLSFQLNDEIGKEGGNSQVFKAHDPQLDTELVIKKILKAKLSDSTEYYEESRILYLSGHPNVVPIHYACEDNDSIYLAMPYYAQGSLNQLLDTKNLTVREIIKFSSQFLSGLHNIHSKQLIHFDIKPDNILISNQGEAVLSDFGLSKPVSISGLAGQDRMYFKMHPPEAYDTEDFSIAFDIYQVGLTLYRMCFGNAIFYEQFDSYGDQITFDRSKFKFDVKNGRFPSRDNFPEHIPQALINVIKKCLSVNPAERFSSILHIVNEIAHIDDHLLDWVYTVGSDKTRVWEKTTEERIIRLSVDINGRSLAQKIIGARTQKINDYCLESINRSQIKEFLRAY